MSPLEIAAILLAGLAAGTVNTIVGSGSLVTFPTLLAFGYSPLVANVSNTLGLVPGSISGSIGYRRELAGQGQRARRLGMASAAGGLTGGLLLLALPAAAFDRIVPVLILLACLLVAIQPRLSRALASRQADGAAHWGLLFGGVYLAGIYGGYFGAAQGVILIALLGIFLPDDLQRLNGLKNVLAATVNAVAAVLFVFVAPVAWAPAAVLAIGSIAGGQVGAHYGRRLSPRLLRVLIIVIGVFVAGRLLLAA
ncbi:MAG TPA: sulfite exporter TauE/SafE family protein [Candidatus Sulfotelmatobacter sp.]|nr:sulfite exporter TauE/SafE family protein [Candidatus Sulfotelmatobacter sp.]